MTRIRKVYDTYSSCLIFEFEFVHTYWSLFRSGVMTLKELRNLLPSFMYILSTTLPNLSKPGAHLLLLTLIRSRRFWVKPASLLVPIDLFFSLYCGGVLRYLEPQWLHFPNICGSEFHCLRNIFYSTQFIVAGGLQLYTQVAS
jgi:hypothetical protein